MSDDATYAYLKDADRTGRRPAGRRRPDPDNKWRRRLLTKVEQEPSLALADQRCHTVEFVDEYFDLVDGKSLVHPGAHLLELARVGEELARIVGGRHLKNRGLGIQIHALFVNREYGTVEQLLAIYRIRAFFCCRSCRSDQLFRRGDYLGEIHEAKKARDCLLKSLAVGGDALDDDRVGRIHFPLAIAHHYLGDTETALRSAHETLRRMALESPRGYFLDTIALVMVYLPLLPVPLDAPSFPLESPQGDTLALEILEEFEERLKGNFDIADIRARLGWALGVLLARLGERKRGLDRLDSARRRVVKIGLAREAVGITLDHAILLSHNESSVREIRRILTACLHERQDLDEVDRQCLNDLHAGLKRHPESTFGELVELRLQYITPLPGRVPWPQKIRVIVGDVSIG